MQLAFDSGKSQADSSLRNSETLWDDVREETRGNDTGIYPAACYYPPKLHGPYAKLETSINMIISKIAAYLEPALHDATLLSVESSA